MDSFLLWLSVGGAALLLVAIVTAWWEHVKRLAEIREQLAWSENSRFALEAHAREVDAKLLAMNSVLQAQQHQAPLATAALHNPHAGASVADPTAAQSTDLSALQTAAPESKPGSKPGGKPGAKTAVKAGITALAASGSAISAVLSSRAELQEMEQQPTWQDTEPMVLTTQTFDFEPTQPVDLSHH